MKRGAMTNTTTTNNELIKAALEVRKQAYVPYSGYQVGAALLGKDGKIYAGANVENASYSLTNCAERSAIFSAVSQGVRKFETIVVATDNGGSPCGACRQVLAEFGTSIRVIIVDQAGNVVKDLTVGDLLPEAFLPEDLERS